MKVPCQSDWNIRSWTNGEDYENVQCYCYVARIKSLKRYFFSLETDTEDWINFVVQQKGSKSKFIGHNVVNQFYGRHWLRDCTHIRQASHTCRSYTKCLKSGWTRVISEETCDHHTSIFHLLDGLPEQGKHTHLNPFFHPITVPQTTARAIASSAPHKGRVWRGHRGPRCHGRPPSAPLWSDMESW